LSDLTNSGNPATGNSSSDTGASSTPPVIGDVTTSSDATTSNSDATTSLPVTEAPPLVPDYSATTTLPSADQTNATTSAQ
jgi:hypothetical protein